MHDIYRQDKFLTKSEVLKLYEMSWDKQPDGQSDTLNTYIKVAMDGRYQIFENEAITPKPTRLFHVL